MTFSKMQFTLSFGALSPDIEDQLMPQGLTLGSSKDKIQKWADSITGLRIHALLTNAESDRARMRLMKEIKATAKPVEAVQP